jgi:hypothetical protein
LLQHWVKKISTDARGLTLKLVDGTFATLHPPYMVGDDYVAGSMVEGKNDEIAYPFTSLISVQPLGPAPKGF